MISKRYAVNVLQLSVSCVVLIFITGFIVMPAFAGAAQNEGKAAAAHGRKLYIRYGCYQCHGYEGQGGLTSGPRLAPDPVPLPAFIEICRRPYGVMPAYSPNVLSDEKLGKIHAYLLSITSKAGGD